MTSKQEPDPHSFLPLNDVVFQVLLLLHDGERHGYRIAKELQRRLGRRRIAPGNLYRTLRTMLDQGLVEESGWRPDPELDDERRRYFCLTELGRRTTRAEATRLEALVESARRRHILEPQKERAN